MTRPLAIAYLVLQGLGAVTWWVLLLTWPAARQPFLADGAPDSTLLAFGGADLSLYAGLSLLCAYGLARGRRWAWPLLLVHVGAAAYAALYCLALPVVSGRGWLGAVLMAPSLVVPGLLAWLLRPKL